MNAAPPIPAARRSRAPLRGFTLIELVVVVAIVIALLGILLPGASRMWEERKLADTVNTIQGMVMTARAKALEAGGLETGMFFYVDQLGVQQIRSIAQVPRDASDVHLANVFEITQARAYNLPAPMRVVPRYAVVESNAANSFFAFSDDELAKNNILPKGISEPGQRHRNFFTIVFDGDGELAVGRDVLIVETDNDNDNMGDVSGLPIGHDEVADQGTVSLYYEQSGTTPKVIDPTPAKRTVDFVLYDDGDDAAFNFPSVDGLLVYDDSLFNSLEAADEKRAYLLDNAQPLYIHPATGAIIRGPLGEAN